jgi:hypothetical protein
MSLSTKKPWLYLQLITSPCLSSKECTVFNVTCYLNGKIIFHGINNTAYIGKKIFQLETNRIIAVRNFIQTHSLKSDLEFINILFHIELSHNHSEIYFWRNDSVTYTILTSLLTIDKLSSYKRWSILLRTAHRLANIRHRKQSEHLVKTNSKQIQTEQRSKRSIKTQYSDMSTSSNPVIIPTTQSFYIIDDYNVIPVYYIASAVQSIKTTGLIRTNFDDDDFCFSSQVTISTFDLVDACLSTDDIIDHNQFYPLREQFIWVPNQNEWANESIDLQGKFDIYFKIGH